MIDPHTLNVLEYPKIISLIAGKCLTPYGRHEVEQIQPLFDAGVIGRRLDEVSQLKDIINFGEAFPLYRLDDCREFIEKSQVEGVFLEPDEIAAISELVGVSIQINQYDREGRAKFPDVAEYISQVRAFPELKKEIRNTLDDDGNIKDSASPQLKRIRNELSETRHRVISRLEKILATSKKQPGWQDDVVTVRNNRYVIPVPSNNYRSDVGILHDRSQSGATFFIEPQETVESNNRINILLQEERQEIDRILRALTREIAGRAAPLLENTRLIGILDCLHAEAGFSNQIGGNCPNVVSSASFDLVNARHPLLAVQFESPGKVVPNSLGLDDSRQTILVTGPNTGGKTITLKTVGLSILMAQSGMHIAADDTSTVGIFEAVFADIGDEQSIEQSLSTFSSHIRNIIHGLNGASDKTLLLFDEIGVGTDPKEGSALAESIILHAVNKGSRMVATTHYSQLKVLATEYPQIENASLEFDRDTLSPTYRLHLGLPGSSYAVEIAGRLGMPKEICERASKMVGSSEKSMAALTENLEKELATIHADRIELTQKLEEARELEASYRKANERLESHVEEEKHQALSETATFLDETRREIERLVAEIRKSQASKASLKEFHERLKNRTGKVKNQLDKLDKKKKDSASFEVGDSVEIISLNARGEISELIGKDKARIKIGNIVTTVEIRNLRNTEVPSTAKQRSQKASFNIEEVENNQIHLRGMTAEEALENLERFLDHAVIAGFEQVYVIHGKGTGVLRRKLTDYLKERPDVASIRLGNWNEGGAGVTVVKLKS